MACLACRQVPAVQRHLLRLTYSLAAHMCARRFQLGPGTAAGLVVSFGSAGRGGRGECAACMWHAAC